MLIDGILILALVAIFVVVYVLSVRSAKSVYREYCRKKTFYSQSVLMNKTLGSSFPIFGLAPSFIILVVFVVVAAVVVAVVAVFAANVVVAAECLPPFVHICNAVAYKNNAFIVYRKHFECIVTVITEWLVGKCRSHRK